MGHLTMAFSEAKWTSGGDHEALVPERPEAAVHVVDDDESLRNAIRRVLQLAGFEVRTYASAGEFLLDRPDHMRGCLLLDVRMPGPTGLDLQESLARRGAVLPIIFLTGNGDLPMCVQAMRGGAVDFQSKPAPRDVLLAAVQRAMRRGAELLAERDLVQRCLLYTSPSPRDS